MGAKSRSEQLVQEDPKEKDRVRRRQASHITVVLSKAALSGPSVCLRARAPCPLRVSYLRPDRAKRAAKLQAVAFWCPCLRQGGPKPFRKSNWKTLKSGISVFPTGTKRNIGNTGPNRSCEVGWGS
jgi:hypothetical protein